MDGLNGYDTPRTLLTTHMAHKSGKTFGKFLEHILRHTISSWDGNTEFKIANVRKSWFLGMGVVMGNIGTGWGKVASVPGGCM